MHTDHLPVVSPACVWKRVFARCSCAWSDADFLLRYWIHRSRRTHRGRALHATMSFRLSFVGRRVERHDSKRMRARNVPGSFKSFTSRKWCIFNLGWRIWKHHYTGLQHLGRLLWRRDCRVPRLGPMEHITVVRPKPMPDPEQTRSRRHVAKYFCISCFAWRAQKLYVQHGVQTKRRGRCHHDSDFSVSIRMPQWNLERAAARV